MMQKKAQRFGKVITGIATTGTMTAMLGNLSAIAAPIQNWQYNPQTSQLTFVLPDGIKPRYFLMAQPARIVVDIPDTQIGDLPLEQEFSGAIKRVSVSQLQPQLMRVILEMSPDVVFGRGQVKLDNVGDFGLPNQDRWVITPILQSSTASAKRSSDAPKPKDISKSEENTPPADIVSTKPVAEPLKPVAKPVEPKPETSKPIELKPVEVAKPVELKPVELKPVEVKPEVIQPTPQAVAPQTTPPTIVKAPAKPDPKPAEAPPGMESVMTAPSVIASAPVPVAAQPATPPAIPPMPPSRRPSETATPSAIVPIVKLPPAPPVQAAPTQAPPTQTPSVQASAITPSLPAGSSPLPPQRPIVSVPPLSTVPVLSTVPAIIPAPTPVVSQPPAIPGLPPMPPMPGTASSSTMPPLQAVTTNPTATPTIPTLAAQQPASIPPLPPQPSQFPPSAAAIASQTPGQIPMMPPVAPRDVVRQMEADRPTTYAQPYVQPYAQPYIPTTSASLAPTPTTSFATSRPNAGVIDFGQPLPGATSPIASAGGGIQALDNITTGGITVPAGNVLSLRYDRLNPLKLKPGERQQEILVLQTPILDSTGQIVVPQGSLVLGEFDTDRAGSRFTARVLTTPKRNLSILAQSNFLQASRQVSNRNILQNSGIGAVAGAIVGGLNGTVLGGAAAGAAITYATSPRETLIQPGQVLEVRLVQDFLASR